MDQLQVLHDNLEKAKLEYLNASLRWRRVKATLNADDYDYAPTREAFEDALDVYGKASDALRDHYGL